MMRSKRTMLGMHLACCVLAASAAVARRDPAGVVGENEDGLGPPPTAETVSSTAQPSRLADQPEPSLPAAAPREAPSAGPANLSGPVTGPRIEAEQAGRANLEAISASIALLLERELVVSQLLEGPAGAEVSWFEGFAPGEERLGESDLAALRTIKTAADSILGEGTSPSTFRERLASMGVDRRVVESVVDGATRPAFPVCDGEVAFKRTGSMDEHLDEDARAMLATALQSVCYIKAQTSWGTPNIPYYGTGFRAGSRYVITNRHVVEGAPARGIPSMVETDGHGRHVPSSSLQIFVDFGDNNRNCESSKPLRIRVDRIAYYKPSVEHPDASDVAVLVLADSVPSGIVLPPALPIDWNQAHDFACPVGVIGFPAPDSRESEDRIRDAFGPVDGLAAKFVSAGMARDSGKRTCELVVEPPKFPYIFHDCSTLGGSSGSPLIDLNTGMVVGLHFRGVADEEREKCPHTLNGNLGMQFSRMPEAVELRSILAK